MTLEDYKKELLSYLFLNQKLEKKDAEAMAKASKEDKKSASLLLDNVTIKEHDDEYYVLNVPDNYSKLRAGDKVSITNAEGKSVEAVLIDVLRDEMTVQPTRPLDGSGPYEIEAKAPQLLQSLIACLEDISAGKIGAAFLRLLAGDEPFEMDDFLKIEPEGIKGYARTFSRLNAEQQDAVRSMLQFPPLHVLQGPPGTGKTMVLAAMAIAATRANREVVVIANTHQAVNNALAKIYELDSKIPIFKVGEILKAEELNDNILKFAKFSEYSDLLLSGKK